MALTDITAPADFGASFTVPQISRTVLRRVVGCALALFAYMIWIVPMGIDSPALVPLKLAASSFMLAKALGMCLSVRAARD